jgi:hypothetical protein
VRLVAATCREEVETKRPVVALCGSDCARQEARSGVPGKLLGTASRMRSLR